MSKETKISFRKCGRKEVSQIFALSSKIFRKDFPYAPRVVRIYSDFLFNQSYFRKHLKKRENLIIGAFEGKNLIGFISLKGDFGGVASVNLLFVHKNYRQAGIGSRFLKLAEEWSLKNKYHYLWLFSETEKNIKFYKKRGFKYVGCHKKSWFGEDEYILAKALKAKPFPEIFKKYLKTKK